VRKGEKDIDESGRMRDVLRLEHQREFNRTWSSIPTPAREAIEKGIIRRLDELITSPDQNWGSITKTSIEGGQTNPITGVRGNWSGTVYDPIFQACGRNEELAGMFFGNVWKKVVIARHERWIGVRLDPTLPQRGITLQGKSYFLDTSPKATVVCVSTALICESTCPKSSHERITLFRECCCANFAARDGMLWV
jgi:hypothetical protein